MAEKQKDAPVEPVVEPKAPKAYGKKDDLIDPVTGRRIVGTVFVDDYPEV